MASISLDEKAIQRIVEATGLEAAHIDRKDLAHDLKLNWTVCASGRQVSSSKVAKDIRNRLEAIAKASKKLRCLLPVGHDNPVWGKISSGLDFRHVDPRDGLDRLIAAVNKALATTPTRRSAGETEESGLTQVFANRSAFEVFAGFGLPSVFEEHFRREVRLRRKTTGSDSGKLYGPYILFACQALVEMGITTNGRPYSAESIARALQRGRRARERHPRRVIGQK